MKVINMAKNGAEFFYEKKSITSDKAIALLKKNKKLNIHSERTNNSAYKVWISKKEIYKNKPKLKGTTILEKDQKIYMAKQRILIHSLKKLTQEEIEQYEEDVKKGKIKKQGYFLNGKETTLRKINMIKSDDIKSINITENEEGFKSLYVIRK
jgi:hypothetical protein